MINDICIFDIFFSKTAPPIIKFVMIKFIVVDDYLPALTRITNHVSKKAGYKLLATSNDGYELIKYCKQQKVLPDIVLLDVLMPKLDGVSTMEYLHIYYPSIKVIAVSSFEMDQVVIDMLAGGAWGYVFKDKGLDILSNALDAVLTNTAFVDPRLSLDATRRASLLVQRVAERNKAYTRFGLTKKEQELISLIVSNLSYAEIGELLNTAPKTIENTVTAINNKMGITNGRPGLLIHCIRMGLTKMMNLQSVRE